VAVTLQQEVGGSGEPASATDEHTVPSPGVFIPAWRMEEHIARRAQRTDVSR